ncbi:MAG: hypothetical protein RIR89_1119 [Actinomycetota bacterium]
MTIRGNVSALRLVLRAGATVFGLSALLLIAVPRFFTDLLGMMGSAEVDWSMRMIGLTLVALAGNMLNVSLNSDDKAVVFSARVMQFSAFGLGVLTLLIPNSYTWFVILYAAVGFSFSAAYTIFLTQKSKR